MYEEMALNYYKGLSKTEKKRIMKKLFDMLNDDEKLEFAKMFVGKN